jgi:membrane-associated phospholipid phosphatase
MSNVDRKDNYTLMERIAQVISAILHPLILPAIAFTLLVIVDPNPDSLHKLIMISVAIVFSVVLVPAYIFFLKHKGVVDSADIVVREQRINPLTMGAVSYFIGFLLLNFIGASSLVQGLMFCYATNTLLVVLITNWWKVSVHTTAISGPLVVLAYQFGSVVLPFFGLIPLVGASRLILKRHTLAQVLVGAAIDILLTALQIQLFFGGDQVVIGNA